LLKKYLFIAEVYLIILRVTKVLIGAVATVTKFEKSYQLKVISKIASSDVISCMSSKGNDSNNCGYSLGFGIK